MKVRSRLVKPLAAAALLCTGASYAAPPVTSGLSSVLGGSGGPGLLNFDVVLGSPLKSLGDGMGSLPALGSTGDDSPLNPFAQGSFLHHNPAGQLVFDTANVVRSGTGGLIPVNSERPDLPGLRKDATSRLVHDLQLYELTEGALDALSDGASNLDLPLLAGVPELRGPLQEVADRNDGHDNGFLGVGDSTTLGTDSDRDPGDNGFLGIADSSTLGTD